MKTRARISCAVITALLISVTMSGCGDSKNGSALLLGLVNSGAPQSGDANTNAAGDNGTASVPGPSAAPATDTSSTSVDTSASSAAAADLLATVTGIDSLPDPDPFLDSGVVVDDPVSGAPGVDPFSGSSGWSENPLVNLLSPYVPITDGRYTNFMMWMRTIRDDYRNEAIDVLVHAADLEYRMSTYNLIIAMRDITGFVINQDSYDNEAGTYWNNLAAYMNRIYAANTGVKNDVLKVAYNSLDYLLDPVGGYNGDLEQGMTDMRAFLADTSGQNITSLLSNLEDALGKLLMRADTYIQYDDPLDADPTESTGLGNAVSGVDSLMTGINSMATQPGAEGNNARDDLYDILRMSGQLIHALKGAGPTYYPALKNLLTNIENYYTIGGANYSGDYNHPMAGSPNNYYTNAELSNSLKEMWPSITKLFLRERDDSLNNSDYSIVGHNPSGTQSPVEMLAQALYQLKVSGVDYSAAGNELEPSLKNMVKYNAYAQDRATAPYKVSLLDHLSYTMGIGYNFGFLTRDTSGAGGEPYNNQPTTAIGNSYQHGAATRGILTVNDTMYPFTSGAVHVYNDTAGQRTLDVWTTSYNLALAQRHDWNDGTGSHDGQGKYVWRSNASFTPSGGAGGQIGDDPYEFYMGYDYPVQCLLGPSAAGDAGIPNGGQRAVTPTSNATSVTPPGGTADQNDYRTYFPKVADGKGDLNTATWMVNWMSRACWDGAGPYYSKAAADLVDKNTLSPTPTWAGHASFYVAYKPNGEVYAYIDKIPNPWQYFYPSKDSPNCRNRDGSVSNDVTDTDGSGQRANRYRYIYKSDYYAVQKGHEHGSTAIAGCVTVSNANGLSFCVPPMNPSGTAYNDSGRGQFYLSSGSFSAQQFWTREKIQEWTNGDAVNGDDGSYPIIGNVNRECLTQEEAIFRNYQWLLYEKKFMFVIPQCLFASWDASFWLFGTFHANAYLDSAAYVVIEANGLVGLANAKKGTSNGFWNIRGTQGLGADNAASRNNPDYGNSYRPGDSRIIVFANYYTAAAGGTTNGTIGPDVVWGLFGAGHVLPDAIGANMAPVQRLGFIDQAGYIGSVPVSSTAAPTGRGFLANETFYLSNRNRVLPLFVALAGALSDGTYYDVNNNTSGPNNYNYTSKNHKYPIHDFLAGIMIPLSKPLLRMYDDGGAVYGKRWVPRMMVENTVTAPFYYFTPATVAPYNTWDSFRPLDSLHTLTSFLADQNVGEYYNGLIPALADNNAYVATRLMALFQRIGNSAAPYGGSGGVLENFGKGLEQVISSIQVDKGQTFLNGYSWLDNGRLDRKLNTSRYGWMFTNNLDRNGSSSGTSPVSLKLNVALEQLIGNNNTTGLSKFVDDHESPVGSGNIDPAKWANYDRVLNMAGDLLGNTASPYYIMDDPVTPGAGGIIGILNKVLTNPSINTTSTDLKAVRHTLGILMERSGTTDTLLPIILKSYLPDVLSVFPQDAGAPDHARNLLLVGRALLDWNNDGLVNSELPDFMTDMLQLGDTPQAMTVSVYNILNGQEMWDPAYLSPVVPREAVLKTVADVFRALASEI